MRRDLALLIPLFVACAGPTGDAEGPQPAGAGSATAVPGLPERSYPPVADADEAFAREAALDPLAATYGYAQLLREAAEALATADAAGSAESAPSEEALRLADEVEVLALHIAQAARRLDKRLPGRLLAGVEIAPRHGMAWARVEELRDHAHGEILGMLQDWSLIGPFDNERGVGMAAATPPELAPAEDALHQGRVREVGWRLLPPGRYPDGRLPVGALVRPDRQSALLLRTWVRSESTRDAVLLLGVQGEVRVWADGVPVLDAFEERDIETDGLAAPLQLQQGWTELVVKLGSRDRLAVMTARLVEPGSAAPLKLAAVPTPPPDVQPCALGAEAGPQPDPTQHPGALGRALTTASTDAEALFRRALLEEGYAAAPRAQYPGRAAATQAAEAAPEVLRYQLNAARMLEPRAEVSAELDLNPWLHQIESILEMDPAQPAALLMQLQHVAHWQRSRHSTLEVLDQLHGAAPDSIVAQVLTAWAYETSDLDPLSDATWHRIADHPDLAFYPQWHLSAARRAMRVASPEQLAALRACAAGEYGTDAMESLHEHVRRTLTQTDPRFERAAVDEVLAQRPWNDDVLRPAAKRLIAVDQLDAASALLDEVVALCPEEAESWKLRARIALARDDQDAAIRALEQVLVYDFAADDERRLLEMLLASGGGSFEAAWFEPLEAVLDRHPAAEGKPEAGHEILLYRTVVRVKPDGTTSTYRRKVSRVLDLNGVRELDRERFWYSWEDQDLRLLTAAVRRPDGRVEEAATGRGWRGSSVDLPPLEVGDVVDLEWRVDDLRTGIFGSYVGIDHAMSPNRSVPVRRSELVLLVPDELPLKFHTIGMDGVEPQVEDRAELGTAYAWSAEDLAPERTEARMPASFETVARVQASSYEDWQEFGDWWWNLIDESITASPEMQAKVAELTAGLDTPAEKLRAIYDFVVTDIRYQAWEFGVHGYQPYSAPVIFSRGFGDCKDKAILLKAMLAEVDIESHPVVILRSGTAQMNGLRSEEDHTLALISHFNHAIAYLPEQEGIEEMYLDGTARLHPREVLPYDDRGAKVVVVEDGDAVQRRIAFVTPEVDHERRTVRLAVEPDGSADVEYVIDPSGRFDPRYRYGFAVGEEERGERAERMMSSLFGPFDGEVEAELPDVEDLSGEVDYVFRGHARSVARSLQEGLEVPAAVDKLELLQGVAAETERRHDLLFEGPYRRSTTLDYVDLGAWESGTLPQGVTIENEDAAYSWSISRDGDVLQVEESFEVRTHRIPAERYAAFRELCRTVDEIQDSFILLTPKP